MKNKKTILLAFLFILIISTITACKSEKVDEIPAGTEDIGKEEVEKEQDSIVEDDEYGITVTDTDVSFTDGRGEKVTVSKNPEKAVVLFGSYLDIWTRNGGEMVGMIEPSEWMDIPNAESIKVVGKRGSVSIEDVVALNPDLIVMSSNTGFDLAMVDTFEQTGAKIIALDYYFKDDYFKIAKIFALINDEEYLYQDEAKAIKDKIQDMTDKIPDEGNPSAAVILNTTNKLSLRTADTTIGEMFKDLKVTNIADPNNDKEGNLDFSLEVILQEDPDYIFIQTMGSDEEAVKAHIKSEFESNPAWSSLKAVKEDRYIILPKDLYTYKANHRYEEAYAGLGEILYPEIFN